jgi:hypothetical protein
MRYKAVTGFALGALCAVCLCWLVATRDLSRELAHGPEASTGVAPHQPKNPSRSGTRLLEYRPDDELLELRIKAGVQMILY